MDAAPPRKRPWYRLHLSTYFVLLVPLSLWVLVAVPAYNEGLVYCATGMPSYRFVEHGWPLVHMDRIDLDSLTADEVASAEDELRLESSFRWAKNTGTGGNWVLPGWGWWGWNEAANWKQTGAVAVIHKVALAINLLVAVAICAAVAGPYEWWRKRRFRYSLRSLLVLFVVVAAVFGWGRWRANQRSREAAAIEQLEKLGYAVDCRYWGPIWLARLVGEHHLSIFICAINCSLFSTRLGYVGRKAWIAGRCSTWLRNCALSPRSTSVVICMICISRTLNGRNWRK